MDDGNGRQLQSVGRAVEVLGALQELDGAGVTELADHLGASKASVHHHLMTLRSNHLVVRQDDEYRLGLRFLAFGEYVRNQNPLYSAGTGEVDGVAADTGEFAHLMTEQFGRAIHLYKSQGEQAVGKPYHRRNLQRRDYLHYSAAGKAILSCLQDRRVEEIIDTYGLPARTEETITVRERLHEELDEVREAGYAVNDEEEIPGLRAVAAPIDPDHEDVVGAVSVSGPVSRIDGSRFETELPETVIRVTNVIELNIDTANQ
jgi:DNA-binding IclR family transcriptional regulator